MLKIGVVGLGQMGGNLADIAAQHGLQAVVCNSSALDLGRLQHVVRENRYHLEYERDGAGANRGVGRQTILQHVEKLQEFLQDRLVNCDLVLVVSSSSGGCGSGSHWIGIELVSEFCDNIGSITTLPMESEDPQAHINTSDFFKELSRLNNLDSVMIVDNQRAKEYFPELSKRAAFERINKDIVENIIALNELTNEQSYTTNLDDADLLDIISQNGAMVISRAVLDVNNVETPNDITKAVHESWNQYHTELVEGQIVKAAVVAKIPENLSDYIDSCAIFSKIGQPLSVREVCFKPAREDYIEIYTIMTGLAYPTNRLSEIDKKLEAMQGTLLNQLEASTNQEIDGERWADKFSKKRVQSKTSLRERLAQFN